MSSDVSNEGLVLKQLLPYINKYRDNSFLFVIPSYFLVDNNKDKQLESSIWEDISACANLDIGCLVLVDYDWPDSTRQGISKQEVRDSLPKISSMEKQTMALLARGFYGYNRKVNIISGSWFLAQTKGVLKGKDMQHYGKIRFIDKEALSLGLQQQDIVVFSNIVPDKQGNFYAVDGKEMALDIAVGLGVDKVVSYIDRLPQDYKQVAIDLVEAKKLHSSLNKSSKKQEHLVKALEVSVNCCKDGIKRSHIIPGYEESALLKEILTIDGCGFMVNLDGYEQLSVAAAGDAQEIKKLIAPWEEKEVLRPRSYEDLQKSLDNFCVIKRDDNIIGCAALSEISDMSDYVELECVVVRDSYKQQGYGKRLLNSMEKLAVKRGYRYLVVFTTQTATWFEEAGYKPANVDLPVPDYCSSRNSKHLIKHLR